MSMLSRCHTICKYMHYPPGQLNQRGLVGVMHIEASVIFFFLTSHKLLVPLTRVTDCKESYKAKCKAEQNI